MRYSKTFPLLALLLLPMVSQAQEGQSPTQLALMPGDAVRVRVWREGDLSGDFTVNPDGRIVLPLLGEQKVTDRPWTEVNQTLMEGYARELQNPSVELTPLRRVYVLGYVNNPGLFAIEPTLSLAGVVAIAGGANEEGDLRKLRVVREGEVILDGIPGEEALFGLGIWSGDQLFVGRRGWFERNSTFLATAALSLTTIIVTLVSR